ncbi:hypothetical protein N9D57_03795 [bacterium]|nr:hypothetical protein [bacterium]
MTKIPTRQRRRRTRTLGSLNAFTACYTLALLSSGSNNNNNNNNNGNGVLLKVVSAARMMAAKPFFWSLLIYPREDTETETKKVWTTSSLIES